MIINIARDRRNISWAISFHWEGKSKNALFVSDFIELFGFVLVLNIPSQLVTSILELN